MMLCEEDKLEEAEPFMNRLVELFPNDPQVAILKGLFEHLMEETEDAQRIWKRQMDGVQRVHDDADSATLEEKDDDFEYEALRQQNEALLRDQEMKKYTVFDLWAFPLRIALQFGCSNLADTILAESEPLFQDSNDRKIDFVLLQHEVLVHRKQFDAALSRLGEAILMNDGDVRLWLRIGSTYHSSGKWTDSQEALQRHIAECSEKGMFPNVVGMLLLIRIYLTMNDREPDDELLERAASVIELCWERIENGQIFRDDVSAMFGSFDHDDVHLMEALKYKLRTIQGSYCSVIEDTASALSHYAVKCLFGWFHIDSSFMSEF